MHPSSTAFPTEILFDKANRRLARLFFRVRTLFSFLRRSDRACGKIGPSSGGTHITEGRRGCGMAKRGMWMDGRGAEMAEAAVVLPVVLLLLLFVINGSMAGYTSMAAASAAEEGAKAGAVARDHPEAWASAAVAASMAKSRAGGGYTCSVKIDPEPGGGVKVMVAWSYPSMLSGLCRYFGGNCPRYFSGVSIATRKREGW
jgi:hypothetical protein